MKRNNLLRKMYLKSLFFCSFLLCSGYGFSDMTQETQLSGKDPLFEMSFEEFMEIEITSVSKRPEKISEAAAAIFVINRKDILQWGVQNIPDALRRVPGLQVAQIDANKWAITSRGFNSRFANKLLVLIDGRSIYTPLFAGVYWETLDMVMEDIERIEVIRGPGGTLWGANAVNGVINIITRSASQTKGGLISAVAGNEKQGTSLRYGGQLESGMDYRIYGKFFQHEEAYAADGGHDDGDFGQLGFRADWQKGIKDLLTFQGDFFSGDKGQQITVATNPPPSSATQVNDVALRGGNMLFRWQHSMESGSDFTLQMYYDHDSREGDVLYEDRDTFDVDFQQHLLWENNHEVVWGMGYRHIRDTTRSNEHFSLNPEKRAVDLFSAFVQNEITLKDYELFLTLGAKFEHNDFTGWEIQPNARITWIPDDQQTLWGAISRAVRTPGRGEQDVRLRLVPQGLAPPVPLILQGSDEFNAEKMIAYEAGYRIKFKNSLSVDLALFYNDYKDLRTIEPEVFPPPEIGLLFNNHMEGYSYGLELALHWQVMSAWRIQVSYSYIDLYLELNDQSTDSLSESAEEASPSHQISAWSMWQLNEQWNLGTGLRYVDNIDAPGAGADSYTELDVRLSWQVSNDVEFSLVGRNLLDNHHSEFQPDFIFTQPTEVERSFFMNLKWFF